jgi:hypothetical protein
LLFDLTPPQFVHADRYDLDGLLDLWAFLDARFFSHLDADFAQVVNKLRLSLQRLYLVNAMQNKQPSKVRWHSRLNSCAHLLRTCLPITHPPAHAYKAVEFFEKYSDTLVPRDQDYNEWRIWFSLPFLKNPESDPQFELYFSPQWLENFTISLKNFLSLIFQNMPMPKLLAFNQARLEQQTLRCELESSQAEVQRLRRGQAKSERKISRMQRTIGELKNHLRNLVKRAATKGGDVRLMLGVLLADQDDEGEEEDKEEEESKEEGIGGTGETVGSIRLQEVNRHMQSINSPLSIHRHNTCSLLIAPSPFIGTIHAVY